MKNLHETLGGMDAPSDSGAIIREATREDVPQLLELYAQLVPDDRPVEASAAIAIWEKAVNSGVAYFVADVRGRIVGTCYIAIIPNITRSGSPIGYLENVVVDAGYRRSGIGRQLLGAAVDHAKKQGCYKVVLKSNKRRAEAHKFYESIGFDGDASRAFEIRF
jgi:GNAT superfamily N-acetyltransferase